MSLTLYILDVPEVGSRQWFILGSFLHCISDRSLIMGSGGGGGYKTGGGKVTFYPYRKKEGCRKGFSHAEGGGGHTKF